MKRLAIFLDGTWNDPDDGTNVKVMYDAVQGGIVGGVEQRVYYRRGVGTKWYNRITGGAIGAGLSDNVRHAYAWLVDNYDDGDDIYIFGFSRGAYTARSVAGVIIKCGLLRRGGTLDVKALYERYQLGKREKPLYELAFLSEAQKEGVSERDRELMRCSRRIDITMVGVWDTVGALGVPWTEVPLIGRRNFYFHNTNLSVLIQHAYHALAIDEFRGPYKPTMWTKFIPGRQPTSPPPSRETRVEQRWFIGAHSNVGGGYADDLLKCIPLAWLQQKAEACGLKFSKTLTCTGNEFRTVPIDSYGQFLGGAYKFLRLGSKFLRPIGAGKREVKGGWADPINETIDGSVFQRVQAFQEYRPGNLVDWAKRKGVDLMTQLGECKA